MSINLRDELIRRVVEKTGVGSADLFQAERGKKHIAEARQIAMWLLYMINGKNAAAASRVFDRDETTARYAIDKIKKNTKLRKVAREILKDYTDNTTVGLQPEAELVEAPRP